MPSPFPAAAGLLERAYNAGVERVPPIDRRRVQTGNLLALVGVTVTTLYALAYLLVLRSGIAAALTEGCATAYLLNFWFIRRGVVSAAHLAIGVVFLSNLTIALLVLFTPETGFDLYFIVVGPLAFLLFDARHRTHGFAVTLTSAVLYTLVQFAPSLNIVGAVPAYFNDVAYHSTVIGVMLVILGVLSIFVKDLEARVNELDRAATTDSLTGLMNRACVFERAGWALERAERTGRPLSVLMMDVDHFKRVNDEHGHAAGDAALAALALLTRGALRGEDLVGRIGGEEFLIVCPGVDVDGAVAVAERIRAVIAAHTIEATDGAHVSLTGSFGVAQHTRGEALSALLSRADHALYAAKTAGRNRTSVDVVERPVLRPTG